jgi:catechol 2,3-dioxygenase-like lactoylglutathione lyase family enzyme
MPGFPDRTHLCDRLLPEEEFDAAFARLQAAGIAYFGDPGHGQPDEIKHRWGGRGAYFSDPDGHNMELLPRQ